LIEEHVLCALILRGGFPSMSHHMQTACRERV
jgi:hypothetical protein